MATRSYNDVLRAKLATLITEHRAEMGDECFEELYGFVKDECLRSFKNGLAAGRSGAARPSVKPAKVKGTALANGRLRPVEDSFVAEEA